MIDTHAHIFVEEFDKDIQTVLEEAFASGVQIILMPAIEPSTFEKMLQTAKRDSRLFCSIGVHPHNANDFTINTYNSLIEYAQNPKVKAIGEIGLDYYYNFAEPETQKRVFIQQINVAKDLNLPIIVHNRESDKDLMEILENEQDGRLRGVLHCFSGDVEMMQKAIDLGFYVSFTGNITYKKADSTREVVKHTPLDRILLETDSPWMAPVPFRGKRNEPKNLQYIAQKIAEIKNISINEVIEMTTKSAKDLFNIVALILFFLTFSFPTKAQEISQDEFENPYPKLIGIGSTLGTNTVVNTYKPEGQDVSEEGLFAYGGSLTGYPLDFIFIQASYLLWQNDKPYKFTKKDTSNLYLDPEKSNQFEIAVGIIPNPHSKVNFFLLTGYSTAGRSYTQIDWITDPRGIKIYLNERKDGIIAGLGFIANLPVDGAGVFTLSAEWRLNFLLNSTVLDVDPRKDINSPEYRKKTEYTTFFSIPRVTLSWFPPLNEWF